MVIRYDSSWRCLVYFNIVVLVRHIFYNSSCLRLPFDLQSMDVTGKPMKSPSGNAYHLIKKPSDHPEEHLRVLASTDFCVVSFTEYFKLSKQNQALQSSLKEHSKQLRSAIKRSHSTHRSLLRLNSSFQTLVSVRDDALFKNLRSLENSVSETVRLIESIQRDFKDFILVSCFPLYV